MSMADVFGNDSAVDPRMDDVLHPADVTILGVGNVILRDEGFGVRAAEYLDAHYDFPESVQVVDGGTLGRGPFCLAHWSSSFFSSGSKGFAGASSARSPMPSSWQQMKP